MKFLRLILLALAALAVVAAFVVGLALDTDIQTWAARRALARAEGPQATVGRVEAGWNVVDVRGLRIERSGAVLTVPSIHAEFPVLAAALRRRLFVHQWVAHGWILDLSKASGSTGAFPEARAGSAETAWSLVPEARGGEPAVSPEFIQRFLERVKLPFDLSLDGADVEGEVILPSDPGTAAVRVHAAVSGGGLGSGREGRFIFRLSARAAAGAPVGTLTTEGALGAAMDSPRTFSRLTARLNAAASGPKMPRVVRLVADVSASRSADGESYTGVLSGENKPIAVLFVDIPAKTTRPSGTWNLDMSDDEVSPFMLGRQLPVFSVVAQGRFDASEPLGADIHVSGSVDARLDRLGMVRPALSAVGAVRISGDFDASRAGDLWKVDRLAAVFEGSAPLFSARSLQPFAFNARTGELQVANAAGDLVAFDLQGVPIEWTRIFAPRVDLSGGPIRGRLIASAHDGGVTLRTPANLSASGVRAEAGDRVLFDSVDASCRLSADYTPQGTQVRVDSAVFRSQGKSVLEGEGKFGRRRGKGEPTKAEGRIRCDLPFLLGSRQALTAGALDASFTAVLGRSSAVDARLSFSSLSANRQLSSEPLPAITAQVRAELAPDGSASFRVPLVLERDGRRSEFTVDGRLAMGLGGFRVDGNIGGDRLVAKDAGILGALLGGGGGLASAFKVSLAHLDCDPVSFHDVRGTIRMRPGAVSVETMTAGVDNGGSMTLDGDLSFGRGGETPCVFKAAVGIADVDLAPLLRDSASQPATIEGKFSLDGTVAGTGASVAEAISNAQGDCAITSKGGRFRLLATAIAPKSASGNAALGVLLNWAGKVEDAIVRRKAGDFSNPLEAVVYLSKALSDVPYDQLRLAVKRDAALDIVVEDLSLISPEIRLGGSGRISHLDGVSLASQPLTANFTLRARGRTAAALKYAGVLDPKADDLGYQACAVPIPIGGSLQHPDTGELQASLLRLAASKSGAGDLFNKLLGK